MGLGMMNIVVNVALTKKTINTIGANRTIMMATILLTIGIVGSVLAVKIVPRTCCRCSRHRHGVLIARLSTSCCRLAVCGRVFATESRSEGRTHI